MLIKINENIYVKADDVLSVEQITRTGSEHYGNWYVAVKNDNGRTCYEIPADEVKILVLDINRAIGRIRNETA